MGKKSSAEVKPRIPSAVDGIQVNFCKNPICANFGMPAVESRSLGRDPRYTLTAAGRKYPLLHCQACGEHPPIKSNAGIAEELKRVSAYLGPPPVPSCPTATCPNHGVGVDTGAAAYIAFGKTRSGSRRYRCRACGKTFSVGKATLRQKQPHKNRQIFTLLMNKMPLKRICEVAEVGMPTVYAKIDFLYAQCLAFAGARERRLREGMAIRRLYVGVDRQDYVVNWSRRSDRRNVQLSAIGSADNDTGYVFGMHLNHDPSLEAEHIEADALANGDCDRQAPHRTYARLWLTCDHDQAAGSGATAHADGSLAGDIAAAYRDSASRSDVESPEHPNRTQRLPIKGMQVHAEYTLYAHFLLLHSLFGGVGKVRFFLDQDSGIRAACLGAFAERVRTRRCDAFYVRINKGLTVDEKKAALAASRAEFRKARAAYPDLDDAALKLRLIHARMADITEIGQWKDRWLVHPFPNMSEPEKAVCHLTDLGDYEPDHLAWLYNKASLHGIDRFFMQVRRRLSLLERPISSASAARRVWHGYSPYNPAIIAKLLDIFRVYYNYCLTGQDGQTPAMRIGLARGPVSVEDLIYFSHTQ